MPRPISLSMAILTYYSTLAFAVNSGGDGEIRTHGPREGSAVFKTAGINHSPTSPWSGAVSRIRTYARASQLAHPVSEM